MNNAIDGGIGHFDNVIDMTGLEDLEGMEIGDIKPQVGRFIFPDGSGVIVFLEHLSVPFPTILGVAGKSQWQPNSNQNVGKQKLE